MSVVVQRNFRRCDRDNEEARVSGRSRGPAAAFNRACRALLTLASISRRQTERLVSPVDSDPGIVESRRSQQHLVPVVIHLVKKNCSPPGEQPRVEVSRVAPLFPCGPSAAIPSVRRTARPATSNLEIWSHRSEESSEASFDEQTQSASPPSV